MCQWLMAKIYDKMMQDAEEKGLKEWRRALLKNISGDILELGCGTGINLEFYPENIQRLVLSEPNPYMTQILQKKILGYPFKIELLKDKAECLKLKNASFDAVVCTLVLCSVKNLEKALGEIYRILKPNGKIYFIEHVAATNNIKRYQWQRRLAFLWKWITDGCHLIRKTEEAICNAGFKIIEIKRQSIRGVPPIVRPSIRGVAVKINKTRVSKCPTAI